MRQDLEEDFNQDLWNGDLEAILTKHDELENKESIRKLINKGR